VLGDWLARRNGKARIEINEPLPQDRAAEAAVIGCVLIDNATYAEAAHLEPSDFSTDTYREAWAVIREVEGRDVDLLTLKAGIRRAKGDRHLDSASLSATIDDIPDVGSIRRYAGIVKDMATRRAYIQSLVDAAQDGWAGDYRTHAGSLGDRLLDLGTDKQERTLHSLTDVVQREMLSLERRMQSPVNILGVPTGSDWLNACTMGWEPEKFHCIAARPGSGKTAYALMAIKAAAEAGKRVFFYSVEMGIRELFPRMLMAEAQVNAWGIRTGNLSDGDVVKAAEASARLAEIGRFVHINEDFHSIEQLVGQVMRETKRNSADLVIVDYLQLLDGGEGDKRFEKIGSIARKLKRLSRRCKVAVLALAQLNREGDPTDPPGERNMGGADSIYHDADTVIFLDAPKRRNPKSSDPLCRLDFIISKNRSGPVDARRMHYDLGKQIISEEGECQDCRMTN
jgi:replicative DNA helicase